MAEPIKLTSKLKRKLDNYNWDMNRKMVYVPDMTQYSMSDWWSYSESKGDCEDYMITKALGLLLDFGQEDWGFDRANIRMATCWVENNLGYHAVLTLITDKGDLVLDNRRDLAVFSEDLAAQGYRFHKREKDQTAYPGQWETITYKG